MRLVVFDTETSGLRYEDGAKILTCHAAIFEDGEFLDSYDWILDWGIDIPEEASSVNGLTREYLAEHGRKDVTQAIREIKDVVLSEKIICAYNIPFDLTLLLQHLPEVIREEWIRNRSKHIIIDPLVLDKARDKYRRGKRTLMAVAEVHGFEVDESRLHTSDYDVEKTAELVHFFIDKWISSGRKLESITSYQIQQKEEQNRSLQEYFRKEDPNAVVERGFPYYDRLNV